MLYKPDCSPLLKNNYYIERIKTLNPNWKHSDNQTSTEYYKLHIVEHVSQETPSTRIQTSLNKR